VQQAGVAALTGISRSSKRCAGTSTATRFIRGWALPASATGANAQGEFYVWGGIPGGEPSARFAKRLLDEAGVVVTPGAGFGPHGEGYFRAALTVDETRLTEAIARIGRLTR